jgi:hypothetical protein
VLVELLNARPMVWPTLHNVEVHLSTKHVILPLDDYGRSSPLSTLEQPPRRRRGKKNCLEGA